MCIHIYIYICIYTLQQVSSQTADATSYLYNPTTALGPRSGRRSNETHLRTSKFLVSFWGARTLGSKVPTHAANVGFLFRYRSPAYWDAWGARSPDSPCVLAGEDLHTWRGIHGQGPKAHISTPKGSKYSTCEVSGPKTIPLYWLVETRILSTINTF